MFARPAFFARQSIEYRTIALLATAAEDVVAASRFAFSNKMSSDEGQSSCRVSMRFPPVSVLNSLFRWIILSTSLPRIISESVCALHKNAGYAGKRQ